MAHANNLSVFSNAERSKAKIFLAAQVASMMGRKLEEGDWSSVYCKAKGIPEKGWSNLHIDINYAGLGVEHKLLRVAGLNGRPIQTVCGTTLMHPALTRSIRIDDPSRSADEVMNEVFRQYADLVETRTAVVRKQGNGAPVDMRIGWLIWEDSLTEFLYFEEAMNKPDPSLFEAEWNITPVRGARKPSKSLWIYEKKSHKKRYSVTTSAGIKIQPYFDVPAPTDPNLYYFRVQSEPIGDDTIQMWLSQATAQDLESVIGELTRNNVSETVTKLIDRLRATPPAVAVDHDAAVPVPISTQAHKLLIETIGGVSDEHRAQLVLRALKL